MWSAVAGIYLAGLIILFAVIAVVVYYAVYSYVINRKIQGIDTKYKKMPGMPRMIGVILLICIFVYIVILTVRYQNTGGADRLREHVRDNFAVIDGKKNEYIGFSGEVELEDASFTKMYSIEENAGYNKQVVTDGEFVFTIFTTNTPRDNFHPDFLCYVTYNGEKAHSMFCKAEFVKPEQEFHSGGSGIGEVVNTALFIGNIDAGCRFSITMGMLDEEAEKNYRNADEPEVDIRDYAETVGSVTFSVEE